MTPPVDDFPCDLLVEVITEYLDGAMAPDEARRFEEHISICDGCASVLEQFRIVLRLNGQLGDRDIEGVPASQRGPLMQAFRDWQATTEA
jgi:anti-sigma factor RsiW